MTGLFQMVFMSQKSAGRRHNVLLWSYWHLCVSQYLPRISVFHITVFATDINRYRMFSHNFISRIIWCPNFFLVSMLCYWTEWRQRKVFWKFTKVLEDWQQCYTCIYNWLLYDFVNDDFEKNLTSVVSMTHSSNTYTASNPCKIHGFWKKTSIIKP